MMAFDWADYQRRKSRQTKWQRRMGSVLEWFARWGGLVWLVVVLGAMVVAIVWREGRLLYWW